VVRDHDVMLAEYDVLVADLEGGLLEADLVGLRP
jgi:hypothetical protein